MHGPFIPQRYYQINVFSSGQYRISCACLLQGYGCIYLACYPFAPAQLQINATKLVDRRTYRSYIDSQWLGWWKIKSFCWASFTDRLWYRREIHKQIKINMEWTKHFLEADSKILNVGILKNISIRILKQLRDLLSYRMFPNLLRLLTLQKFRDTYFQKWRRPRKRKVKNGKPKNVNMGNLAPTEGIFLQHYLRSVFIVLVLL